MKEYKTVSKVAGPLLFVEKTEPVSYEEQVSLVLPDGTLKRGQVLDTSEDLVVVQCFETTTGLGRDTGVRFLGETFKMPVSKSMLGRILSGGGKPIDGGPDIVPDKRLDINGAAINPYARGSPRDFIQTGISTIDGTNTLVRGQKLPIFSSAGLPHNEIALQIARQAKVLNANDNDSLIGILSYVDDATENVLFCVEKPDGNEVLIPASDDFIISVDAKKRKLSVSLPEGLLELD